MKSQESICFGLFKKLRQCRTFCDEAKQDVPVAAESDPFRSSLVHMYS